MAERSGEGRAPLVVCLEELVGEVLGKEREHHVCALRVGNKLSPQQKLLHDQLRIRKLFLT